MSLTPEDKREIDQLIADRLEAESIADKFTTATEAQREEIAHAIAMFMSGRQASRRRPENVYTPRWTQDMADVNTSVGGSTTVANQRGHEGPTLPRWFDQVGGSSWLDPDDPQILHFKGAGGGGTDCMFDWIVSECWATEVTAGRGTEGQAFVSLTGCTFYVTSTVQQAWDGVGDGAAVGAKNFGANACVVFICPGGGIGQLAVSGDDGNSSYPVVFVGSGRDQSFIPGTVVAYALDISGGSRPLEFHDLGFVTPVPSTAHRAFRVQATAGQSVLLSRCRVGSTGGYTNLYSATNAGSLMAYDTLFTPSAAGPQYALDSNASTQKVILYSCEFNHTVRTGKEAHLLGCTFNLPGNAPIGALADTYNGSTTLSVVGCHFRTSAGSWTNYIKIARASITFSILGNEANTGTTAGAVLVTSAFTGDGAHQVISGNSWDTDLGLDHQSTTQMLVTYTNNRHGGTTGASAPTANPIIAQGKFTNSTFDGNGPGRGYVSFSAGSSMNRVNGVMVSTGAPTHTAAEGQEYWDATANTMYTNTDGGTTWAVLGVAGGGASAPSPHAFVGTDHTGDDDYTLRPNVLGIGVSTGDIKVYSDAGVTQVGEWDGALGHIGIGGAATTDAGIMVQPTFTASAATRYGANISPSFNYTGASAIAHYGAYIVPNLTIDAAATQSGAHHALGSGWAVTDNSSGGTISDIAAWSPIISTAGTVIVTAARAIHVHDAVIGGGSIGTYYGIDIPTLSAASLNVGLRNLATSRLVGAVTVGSDAAVSSGVELEVVGQQRNQGDITFDGIAAPGTPAADDIVVYNETGTDLLKAKEDNGAVYNLTHKHELATVVDGSTASTTAPFAGIRVPHAGVITGIYVKTLENITIGATSWIGDVHKVPVANANTDGQGTTIYTTQANRPTISNTNMYQAATAPDVTAVAAGDYLMFYTDQVGTNATFISFTVEVRYT